MTAQFKTSGTVLFKASGTVAMDANCCCEGVETDCCADTIPATLYATFTGSLSPLGTVTMTYDSGDLKWHFTTEACGGDGAGAFLCLSGTWYFQLSTTAITTNWSQDSTSCDPLSWIGTGTVSTSGDCPGDGYVEVTE